MSNAIFKRNLPALGVEGKVSGAERKKLRRALEKLLPAATEEDIEALLPAKAGELESVKLQGRREVIYKLDGVPLILDLSNKGDLVPTVFALWRAPRVVPQVFVKHPAVTQFVVGGADLMLPGVNLALLPEQPFKQGDLLAVCVQGNPAPLAVGTAGMSSQEARTKKGGKLVEVVQFYGDMLWEVLGKAATPNDGFLANAVVPVGLGLAGLDATGYQEDENGQPTTAPAPAAAAPDPAQPAPQDAAGPGPQGEEASLGEAVGGLSLAGGGAGPAAEREAEAVAAASEPAVASASGSGFPPADMDELLELTLLQALHRLKDDALPVTSSVFWAQHMQPHRPAGTTLDVKKSRHKKLGALLKAYGGKQGLLGLKEDKHSGDQVITSVNRKHELYETYRPYRLALSAAGESAGGGGAGPGASPATAAAAAADAGGQRGGSSGGGEAVVVEELWRPGKELRPVFEALGRQHEALYTPQELGEVAFGYVAHAELTKGAPDERTILLDVTLCDALFKGLVKKGELYPSVLDKAALREAFLRRCAAQTRVTRGGEAVVKKGAAPQVGVSVEKRQGHRVTRVVGVESFLVSPDVLASECQRKFACSCTVNDLPGKGQGQEVIIQGERLDQVAAFLTTQPFLIPKRYISAK